MRIWVLLPFLAGCVLSSDAVDNDSDPPDAAPNPDSPVAVDAAAPTPTIAGGVAVGVTDQWSAVPLSPPFTSPIVIATPVYDAASPPLVARVRAVSGGGFELRVERADGSAEPVTAVTVNYVVVEEGVYDAATDGVTMEAVRANSVVTDTSASWLGMSRGYTNTYTNPIVIGQVMSANDAWSSFWARGDVATDPPTSTVLFVGKHVGADPTTARADETIGYLVIEAGAAEIDGVPVVAGVTADVIGGVDDLPPYPQTVDGLPGSATTAVLGSCGMDGSDGAWPILFGAGSLSDTELQLAVDEDQLFDAERSHTTEQLGYLVVGAP